MHNQSGGAPPPSTSPFFRCGPNARVVFPTGKTRIPDEDYFAALVDRHHLEVRPVNEKVGRGLFTRRAFKPGEVIMTEAPVASVVSER